MVFFAVTSSIIGTFSFVISLISLCIIKAHFYGFLSSALACIFYLIIVISTLIMAILSRVQYNVYINHGLYLDVSDSSYQWALDGEFTYANFEITIFQILIFVVSLVFLDLTFCHGVMTHFVLHEHEEEF